jgi:hypothetical protein
VECICPNRDMGVVAEVLLSCCRLGSGAQLVEMLDEGMNKMDWLETSWSQALLLIQDELYMQQSSDESISLWAQIPQS